MASTFSLLKHRFVSSVTPIDSFGVYRASTSDHGSRSGAFKRRGFDAVERVEGPRLERQRSRVRFRLRDLQLVAAQCLGVVHRELPDDLRSDVAARRFIRRRYR
jgi:hypothetical protein